MKYPLLIVLTGKTASGKDTILNNLRGHYPTLHKIITSTSRAPRPEESNGLDYHFYSREAFQQMIDSGEFVEYVEYGGNFYGTEKKELQLALSRACIWRIDPSRAGEIRDFIKRAFPKDQAEQLIYNLAVFYITADEQTILSRLHKRNLPEMEIEKRMQDDRTIWDHYHNQYDYVIENTPGKLDQTVDKIINIISKKNEAA